MQNYTRTKDRLRGEPWESLSKIAGFRWYLSRLENLLLSIYAEHPDMNDPTDPQGKLYPSIWHALGACEKNLVAIKNQFKPPMPVVPKPGCEKGGCWDDNDCFDNWVCRDGFCRPPIDE